MYTHCYHTKYTVLSVTNKTQLIKSVDHDLLEIRIHEFDLTFNVIA